MVKLVQEYFSESAKKYPNKITVNFGDVNSTFSELEKSSNQLARALKIKKIERNDRVAFCLHKSTKSIQVILGILKSDAVYVPLDAHSPKDRLRQVVADAEPKIIICDSDTASLVVGLGSILNLDAEASFITSQSESELDYQNNSGDLAYILYTSGSTGKPKGVMITHANIINATDWAVAELDIKPEDKMSQHPPLHFDLSTFDLYCAFKSGATLCLVPEELSLFPGQLLKFIEENKLTIWDSVPSVMVYMFTAGVIKVGRMPSIKKIFFNGEGFPTKFLASWMNTFPDKEFVNMYGPTETTVQCTFYRIQQPPIDFSKLVPIGKAQRGVEVFAVKDDGTIAKAGEEGELYVGGLGVGLGYWNNPEKTKTSFLNFTGKGRVYKTGDLVRLLNDGNYEFIGRKDFQVKVMGHRIELGDIESALYSLPYVQDAGVVAVSVIETGGTKIVAYVSIKEPKSVSEIKIDLARILPDYMIPHTIELRSSLPRTSTGKIDRPKLKDEYQRNN
ncbi:MAG: amino acid adenylation domain-containing protein [bacterium]|nr:amino acid adenylation domain-containing protein [bacterium]